MTPLPFLRRPVSLNPASRPRGRAALGKISGRLVPLRRGACALLCLAAGCVPALGDPALRMQTSPAIGQLVAALVPALHEEGIEVLIGAESGSSAAIQALGLDLTDVALTVRGLTAEDRANAPNKPFTEFQIGVQASALLVSRDVWEAGVRSLSAEQARSIYERDVVDWKKLGGPERPIKFYSYERGRGMWELFAQWAYGEIRRAPLGNFELVLSGADARNTVEFNLGSIVIASAQSKDDKNAFALALKGSDGRAVAPTLENIASHAYPAARPVYLIFPDKPNGARLRLKNFLLSEAGQALLGKNDVIPVKDLPQQ